MADPNVNPNQAATGPGFGLPTGSITSTTLQQPPVNQYQAPAPTTPYPVQSLVTDPFAQSQPEGQANDLSTQLAGLNQQLVGESAFRTQQNDQLGVNTATSAVNDLSAQLMGLANQSTALQNSAAYTIPNQQQQNAEGRGITAGGLAPLTAAELRKNQIQQGAIATQALTVKSALEAAQGRLANAQYLADQAVKAKFDPVREEIAAKQANLQLIQSSPAYTEAQKKRAFAQQQLLDQQKRTLDQQTEDYKTAQAMAAAAVKNNPNNPQATLAVQQAMKLDQNDPQYLQKIFIYLGQFQVDPNATKAALLDLELKRAQINQIPLDNAYKQAQIANLAANTAQTRAQTSALVPTATGQLSADASSAVSLVNDLLASNLSNVTGVGAYNPLNALPGTTAQYDKAKLAQLKSTLALTNRAKLKGQGQISDFEGKILDQASSALNRNVSPADAQKELRKVGGVIKLMNGVPTVVTLTDTKTGRSQDVSVQTSSQLNKAIADGLLVTFQ